MKPKAITTGAALREARIKLDLDVYEFGRAIGLQGERKSVQAAVYAYQKAEPPPRHICLLAECFLQGARPSSWPD